MQKSFSSNYIKIYIWQGFSFLLNILSMVIAIPYLTKDPIIYGIYSICISVSIFLAYADFGFISAGIKYAAEFFSRNERNNEIKVIGFTSFILLIFLTIFAIIFLILSFHPEFLIKDLIIGREYSIASSLLLIVSIFTPVTLLSRILQIIYSIRLEDFIMQRINVLANIVKIFSVLYFFGSGKYEIVSYFLFCQSANFIALLCSLIIAKKRYHYDIVLLLKSLNYDNNLFNQTKNLAFSSIYITISWILYYEIDTVIIGKFYGAKLVAIYSISLIILTVFRSVFGILFSPFGPRFNHFIGKQNINGLKAFYWEIINYLAPLVVLPILTVSILAKPLILSWIGIDYSDSIVLTEIIILCNIFAFISYPTGSLLMAQEQNREMNIISTIIPIIYWTGIIFSIHYFGLISFAIFKLIAFLIAAIAYVLISKKFLGFAFIGFIKKVFLPMLKPLIFVILSSLIAREILPTVKSYFNLFIVIIAIASIIICGLIVQLFSSTIWKQKLFLMIKSIRV